MKYLLIAILLFGCSTYDRKSYIEGLASGYRGGCISALYDFTNRTWKDFVHNIDYAEKSKVCENLYWRIKTLEESR